MCNKKKCCFDAINWIIKGLGVLLLGAILAMSCCQNGCFDQNTVLLTLILSFIGILATFVIVNNFSQVHKIEKEMSSFANQYDELRQDYLQGVILFSKATILRELTFPNPNKNDIKKELFITVVEALASLTMCNTISPNRERKAMPLILDITMREIEGSKAVFSKEDIAYLDSFFNAILNSTERKLTQNERTTVESIRKRFDTYVKTENNSVNFVSNDKI